MITWLAWPFAIGILLGALMAFTLESFHNEFVRRTQRPLMAALTTVLTTGSILLGIVAGFFTLFVTRLVDLANTAREALRPGGALTVWADTLNRWLGGRGAGLTALLSRLQAGAGEMASRSAALAAEIATGTFSALLGLFFALLTMYAVLRYWPRMVETIIFLSPLHPTDTQAVLDEFRRAGRATLAGTVVTGFAQGVLAGIGFWISGVPQPLFFGAATTIASLVPGIGTLIIWVPVGMYLLAIKHVGHAIVELIWCATTVVGLNDYVIRPRLVGDEGIPSLLIFVALFGGLETLGLPGLIVGPILMALAVATLRLYVRNEQSTRRASLGGHPKPDTDGHLNTGHHTSQPRR